MIPIQTTPLTITLAVAGGRPDPEVVRKMNARAQATITSLLGDKNEVWLGQPEVFDLVSLGLLSGTNLPANLVAMAKSADLLVTQLACSFRPAPDCEFVRATVRAWIESDSLSSERPIAYDLFPRSVEIPISYKRAFSLKPDLTFSFEKVAQLEVSAFDTEVSYSYLKYEPEITAFGTGEANPGWDFNKTKSRPIRGVKDLFVLLKKPKGSPLAVRFEISAWVQTDLGGIPISTFFLSGSDKPLAEEKFILLN